MSRLSQIFVNSSCNQMISLYQLKMRKMNPNSGFLQPYRVMKSASIISNLSDVDMRFLTGFLYITTRRQMNDQTVVFDETMPENSTVVFLNSNVSMTPPQSSTIINWVQHENSSVKIYPGVPKNGRPLSYSQIFANPVSTTDGMKFFSYVEGFSLSLPIFYMKVYKGLQFSINPSYRDINGTSTSFPTTTGLYMKPYDYPDGKVTIDLATADSSTTGDSESITGANMIGFVSNDSSVSVDTYHTKGGGGYSVKPINQILGWSTHSYGDNITISSKNAADGQFFVQYYIVHKILMIT
ncbi:hypothetical protein GCK72_016447 [Caenorhabditis remanei]|uniref:CUB-like domain-containing protein n=1 Tax=Caenorhabditis remanei TaxID=31234 RepID=A0A6A5G5A0_CAERE|nr:hypothetical protein GCK72_016447 [Caenorhabditis remanei]KAF1749902.1 hypothetical protein GCK72_016447 [Caenorhabditis remanei]